MKKFLLFGAAFLLCSTAASADDLVTEQPAGTLRTYHGYSMSTYASWFEVTEPHDGVARQVVFDDNGIDVWFKDPLTHASSGSWIKGTLEDGVITVETPQIVDRTSKGDWMVQRLKKVVTTDDNGKELSEWVVDEDCTTIKYRYTEDSIVQFEEEDIMLGMTRDGEYYYYGEQDVVYTRVSEKASDFPDGSEPELWSMHYNNGLYGAQLRVVFDGGDIYIKGYWKDFPEACIRGSVEGDRIIIPSCQYQGFLQTSENSYYVYFMNSTIDNSSMKAKWVSSGDDMEFAYDRDNRTITPLFGEEMVPLVRNGRTPNVLEDNPRASLAGMYLSMISEIKTLADVTLEAGCVRLEPEYNWGSITFKIPAFDADDNALNTNLISYSIWQDEERLVLDPEDCNFPEQYEGMEGPMEEIPFTFNNDYGIDVSGSDYERYVMFFRLGFTEIGIQTYYDDDLSGKRLYSNITYINPETGETRVAEAPQLVGIGEIEASPEITGRVFFDLNGNRVGADYKGMVVEKVTYSDGTVRSYKKMIR